MTRRAGVLWTQVYTDCLSAAALSLPSPCSPCLSAADSPQRHSLSLSPLAAYLDAEIFHGLFQVHATEHGVAQLGELAGQDAAEATVVVRYSGDGRWGEVVRFWCSALEDWPHPLRTITCGTNHNMCGGGGVSLEVRGQGRSVLQCVNAIAVRVAARDVEVLAGHAV